MKPQNKYKLAISVFRSKSGLPIADFEIVGSAFKRRVVLERSSLEKVVKDFSQALHIRKGTGFDMEPIGLPFSVQVFDDYCTFHHLGIVGDDNLTFYLEIEEAKEVLSRLQFGLSLAG